MHEQLSLLDHSTNAADYITIPGVTVAKRISKAFNSRNHNIIMYKNEKLCYIGIKNYETFLGISFRYADDVQGWYTPCSIYDASNMIDRAINRFINEL